MIIKPNVKLDKIMFQRIKQNELSVVDRVKLVLANFVADLYADCVVYINPVRQGVKMPCFFVELYEVNKQRRLENTACYQIGFALSYMCEEPLNNTLLDNVIFTVQQHLTDLKTYPVQSIDSDITDEIANITGTIRVLEETILDEPIIMKSEKELKINE